MNKSLMGKRLFNACHAPIDDVPNSVSGIFLNHLLGFMKKMEWLKKAETEDTVKELYELAQKFYVIAAVIFALTDV